jgi:two-component system nitrate/nitrite response regulator NarL
MERWTSVLLISDDAMVRTGLRMLLGSGRPYAIAGESPRSSEAVLLAHTHQPDIILLDLESQGAENPSLVKELQAASGDSRIIVLTSGRDPELHLHAVRQGAMGVLTRDKAAQDLRRAMERVHAGELWLDRSVTANVISAAYHRCEARPSIGRERGISALTERESTVARLVCQGLRNVEIAHRLSISEATVRHHLTSILSKLAIANRFALIVFLYQQKFAHPPI